MAPAGALIAIALLSVPALTAPSARAGTPAGAPRSLHLTLAERGPRAPATVRIVLVRGTSRVQIGAWRQPRVKRRRTWRRDVFATTPATLAPGDWRVLSCRGMRCRLVRSRLRIDALPPPATPAPPAPPAPAPLTKPVAAIASAPPPPPPPVPELEPEPGPARRTITECDLPPAADAAPASAFTDLFAASRAGWTGADGTFSARLADGRTAWLFGDTFVGGVREDGSRAPAPFERNSLVVQHGDCLTTVAPLLEGDDAQWYWPSAGVADGDGLAVFLTRIRRTGIGAYDLAVDGSVLVRFDGARFERDGPAVELPARPGVFWGAAVVDDETHSYVYGIDDPAKRLLLARTAKGDLDGPYEFRTADGWSGEVADAEPLLGDAVANQISVVRDGDDLVLATQPPFTDDLIAWRAERPEGPFAGPVTLTTLPRPEDGMTYHALLHTQSRTPGGVLVSYNVNGESFDHVMADASLYRPRFVRAALVG